MNIYKTEGQKLIVLYECAGEVMLGPGFGRDDWTAGSQGRTEEKEGGNKGEWKTIATDDLSPSHLMVFTDWKYI